MGLFQKIKDWFTGKSSSGKANSSRSGGSYTVSRGRYDKVSSGNYGTSTYYRRALIREQQKAKEKKQKVAKAFKADEYKPNPVKAAAAKKAPTPIQQLKKNIETERKEYNAATNNRYNVKGAKTSAERLKRRQAQKSQAFDADALKFEIKHHPIAMSVGRGALNAVTFGASDLAAAKLTRGEARGAEQYYQQNKNKAAETAGEIAGTLLSFGLTGGASAKGVKAAAQRLAPQAFEKGTARAVERVSASKLIQRAAEKEALKRFGADGATREVVAQIAKRRAERAVAELGKDAAINITTGLVYDVNNSIVDSESWGEFARNMGINAGANVLLGGATSLVPQFRVGRVVNTEAGDALIRRAAQNADNGVRPGEAVDIRNLARDAEVPTSRSQRAVEAIANEDEAVARAGEDAVSPNQRMAEDIANTDTSAGNQEMAEQVLKEDRAEARAVKKAEKEKIDLNDEDTARKLVEKRQSINEKLETANSDFERVKKERAAAAKGSEERAALDKEYKSLQRKRRKLEKQLESFDQQIKDATSEAEVRPEAEARIEQPEARTEQPQQSQNVDDFAQVGGTEAQDMGITPDAEVKKPKPTVKQKKLKPNVVNESEGQRLVDRVDQKLGVETNAKKVTPKNSEVVSIEKQYNIGQGSKEEETLSRTAVTLFRNSSSDEQAKSIKKLIKADKLDYNRITNEGKMTSVASKFHKEPERYTKQLLRYASGAEKVTLDDAVDVQYMSWYVVNHVGPMLKEHPELAPLHDACAELVTDLSSRGGQILQLNGVMMTSSPMARRRATLKSIANMLDKSVGVRKKGVTIDGVKVALSGDKDARIKQLIGLIEKDSGMKTALEKLEKATTEAEMDKATAEIMQASMRLKTRTAVDLFQQWRIAGMLGNAKTMVRNRVGNATFGNIRQVSNAVGSGVENYLAKNSDSAFIKKELENRTRGGIDISIRRQSRIKGDKLKDAAAKDAYEAWTTVETKLTRGGKYETKQPTGSTNNVAVKALDWWTNVVSNRLEKDDARALERNFREAYMKGAQQLKKNGKNLADEEVRELLIQRSVQEAQIATFREYNAAADVLTKWTNNLYDADAGLGKKALGFAVESAIPFRKTPMNILKQSVNYSPAGVFNGFRNIRKAAANGDAELLHTAIDQFSSGLTGTGIMIGGFMLGYMSDAFTTNAGSKDYDSKFMKQQGVQNYSMTFTDPVTGEAHSYTLDWLVPASTTFFAGVELANQIKAADGFSLMDFSKNIGEVAARVVEPVFETSMLSGIYNILNDLQGNGSTNSDNTLGAPAIIAREIGQNYLNSLVPTAVGQVARTAYSSDKQLNGQTDMEYWVNSMKNKMGLANTDIITERLGADTTAYGDVKNKKESPKDYAVSALKNLVLPMNIQKVDLNELDKEKIAEYRRRVNAGESPEDLAYLFPRKQYNKNFTVGDTDVKMNNVELSKYNQAKTTGGEEGMRYVLENIMFNRPIEGPDGKKILGPDAYSAEDKAKLLNQFKGKSLREVEQWLYDQPEFKKASDAEKRKAINGLWSLSSQGKAQGAKRVGEQAVYKSRGKDVNEYNFNNEISEKKRAALQPYVDAGVLTYEEAVDFARHAGKTYYYENDEGGTSQTYFNKKQMIEYLESKGYSHEKAEALFNSFKAANAKPYGSSSGRRGYRRRGYRRRGRGGSSRKIVSSTIKSSPYKAKSTLTPKINVPSKAKSSRSGTTSLASALQDIQKTQAKVAPPKAK